jgi:hypothetical protein
MMVMFYCGGMTRRDGAEVKRTRCNRCLDEWKPRAMQRFPTVKGRITWRPLPAHAMQR